MHHRSRRARHALSFVLALGLGLAVTTPVTAQEEDEEDAVDPVPLADALAAMDDDALVIVDAPPEGFPTYQYGDDPSSTAQLTADYATITAASAGLFLFGDEITLSCDDAEVLCSSPEDAPLPDLYLGMSMRFAGEIPLDGVPGQIINYSFPHFDPSAEPFEALPQFPGDTWQGMNRVAVAESRSPFALAPQVFTPTGGWQTGTQHTFGIADGREVWVFVPFGASPEEVSEMETAIITALAEEQLPEGASPETLPQRIADWISRGGWSAAVHVHQGDFGIELPSTITAVPPTPRGSDRLPMPTEVILIGSDGFGFPDDEPLVPGPGDPAPDDETITIDPIDEDADPPLIDTSEDAETSADATDDGGAAAAEAPSTADGNDDAAGGDGGAPTGLLLGGTGVVIVAGVALAVGRRRRGELQETPMVKHVDDGGAAAAEAGLVVTGAGATEPDGTPIHEDVEFDYERDDGTHVEGFGTRMIGGQTTYEYADGTVRRDQEGPRARTVEIAHPDGTREVWSGVEWYDSTADESWQQDSSYTRYDAVGDIIEQTDTDTHPWPEDP
ncbi:MAG: hypothetical protein AAGA90_03690 [Actinomycetota bacterium]